VSLVLRFAGVSRSTYYWRCQNRKTEQKDGQRGRCGRPIPGYSFTTKGEMVSDECIKELLLAAIDGDGYPYGYRKLTAWLRREHGLRINKKKVYRLCRELGILQTQRRLRPRLPKRKVAMNREITGINQLWETDIKYGYIASERRFFFVQTVIDVYDRMVLDYHIGLSCTAEEAAMSVLGAWRRRADEIGDATVTVRSDNGPQFLSHRFQAGCQELGFEHECIPVRTPNKNAHIEAFHSILENECFRRYEFDSFLDAYVTVVGFMDYYNHRRLHGSIGDVPPAEYHEACVSNTARPAVIRV
jgi:putative transposase